MKNITTSFSEHLYERALASFLPKKEVAYSTYFETSFHYSDGSAIDLQTLAKWIVDGKYSGLGIEILSRGVGKANNRVLHHRRLGTVMDFINFNNQFIQSYDKLIVKTISKRV